MSIRPSLYRTQDFPVLAFCFPARASLRHAQARDKSARVYRLCLIDIHELFATVLLDTSVWCVASDQQAPKQAL